MKAYGFAVSLHVFHEYSCYSQWTLPTRLENAFLPQMPTTPHAAARLAAIVESSKDAIISKDLNGIIQTWNAGAEQTYGYKAEEVIGQHVHLLLPPDRWMEEEGILERLRQGK